MEIHQPQEDLFTVYGNELMTICEFRRSVMFQTWAPFCSPGGKTPRAVINRYITRGEQEIWARDCDAALADIITPSIRDCGFDPDECVVLCTGVSQRYLGHSTLCDPETNLTVTTLATASLGNKTSAMSPGTYNERIDCGSVCAVGTVNIISIVNQGLTYACSLEALKQQTEAKCCVIALYNLRDNLGNLCLGTGTDCCAVFYPEHDDYYHEYAGPHTVLGGLIGQSTASAVGEALRLRHAHTPPT